MTKKEREILKDIYMMTETNTHLRDKEGRFEKWAENRLKKQGKLATIIRQKSDIYGNFVSTEL